MRIGPNHPMAQRDTRGAVNPVGQRFGPSNPALQRFGPSNPALQRALRNAHLHNQAMMMRARRFR